jgi:hypothetical protein
MDLLERIVGEDQIAVACEGKINKYKNYKNINL